MKLFNWIIFFLFAFCVIRGTDVYSAPDEIEVYTEDLDMPGEFGLEQHLNYVVKGTQAAEYAGQMATQHVLQMTPEFSYGLTKNLEAGCYLPLAVTPGGYAFVNGFRLRLKYIKPHNEDETLFLGMNVEISHDSIRTSESISGLEIRPIIVLRDVSWIASFNPIMNTGLAADVKHELRFEPAFKIEHSMGDGVFSGLEYYGSYGPINHLLPSNQRAHTVYAVADVGYLGFNINFGIGRGFVNAKDTWVMKSIIELPLK